MRVLASLKASPLSANHAASFVLTCSACCLEWQHTTRSSAYAEHPIMPRLPLDRSDAWRSRFGTRHNQELVSGQRLSR